MYSVYIFVEWSHVRIKSGMKLPDILNSLIINLIGNFAHPWICSDGWPKKQVLLKLKRSDEKCSRKQFQKDRNCLGGERISFILLIVKLNGLICFLQHVSISVVAAITFVSVRNNKPTGSFDHMVLFASWQL